MTKFLDLPLQQALARVWLGLVGLASVSGLVAALVQLVGWRGGVTFLALIGSLLLTVWAADRA
jgi:hypothetical protein